MISFACTCGQKFEVPETAAGDEFQCPKCMRLVNVPLLSELDMIAEDGTFKLYELDPAPSGLAGKMNAFSGRDDKRHDVDEFLAAGEVPPDLRPSERIHGPRYDPETGERVMPVALKLDAVIDTPQHIPMATPVLNYSTAPTASDSINTAAAWWQMPWRLLTGMNLFSMCFVFFTHALIHGMLLVPAANILFAPFVIVFAMMIMAHYCNTVEDFGANHRDRIPVMFRNGSVGEDLLHPLFNLLLSAILAFGPFAVSLFFVDWPPRGQQAFLVVALFWCGIFFFPAALFTASCSGAIQNLAPHRIVSVIIVAPLRYLWAATAFAAACVAYFLALERFAIAPVSMLQIAIGAGNTQSFFVSTGIVYTLLALATYLMHLAAVWLGLIYQSHYEQFNWVLQRHEPIHRTDTSARLAEMRRRNDPRVTPHKPTVPAATVPLATPMPQPVQSIDS